MQWRLLAIPLALGAAAAESYDVVIYDATSAGVMAAYAAAKHGAKTVLVCASYPACFKEGGNIVGGMSAGGLGQTDLGQHSEIIGGFAREFYRRNRAHYGSRVESPWEATGVLVGKLGSTADSCRLPSKNCDVTFNLEPSVAQEIFEGFLKEAGVDVIFGQQVKSVQHQRLPEGPTAPIAATLTSMTLTNGDILSAKVFIDASYEGDLFAAAGVSFKIGREAPTEHGESLAGRQSGQGRGNQMSKAVNPFIGSKVLPFVQEKALGKPGDGDDLIQAYNFRVCVTQNESIRVPFPKPANYNSADWELLRRYITACTGTSGKCQLGFPSCNSQKVPNGKEDMNNCGAVSSDYIGQNREYPLGNFEKRKAIWQEHRDYVEGLLWTMANDPDVPESVRNKTSSYGLCGDEFASTGHFPPALYVREARRLQGDHVFTQTTPDAGSVGNLSIGLGNYNFDSHNAQRFVCRNKSECFNAGPSDAGDGPFVWVEGDVQVGPGIYEIPYWVLLPKRAEVSNLLVTGAPSASHVGMSTLRMEPQFMILGHSAGVAAKLAIESSSSVQGVDLSELQKRLVADGQIIKKSAFVMQAIV